MISRTHLCDCWIGGAPVGHEVAAQILVQLTTAVITLYAILGTTSERDAEGIIRQNGPNPAAAEGTAVGGVAVGLVKGYFAFEESADSVVSQVAKLVGTGSEVRG